MYDVTTQTVSKLSGDLSTAFVDAAESNADSHDSIDDSSFTHWVNVRIGWRERKLVEWEMKNDRKEWKESVHRNSIERLNECHFARQGFDSALHADRLDTFTMIFVLFTFFSLIFSGEWNHGWFN